MDTIVDSDSADMGSIPVRNASLRKGSFVHLVQSYPLCIYMKTSKNARFQPENALLVILCFMYTDYIKQISVKEDLSNE